MGTKTPSPVVSLSILLIEMVGLAKILDLSIEITWNETGRSGIQDSSNQERVLVSVFVNYNSYFPGKRSGLKFAVKLRFVSENSTNSIYSGEKVMPIAVEVGRITTPSPALSNVNVY